MKNLILSTVFVFALSLTFTSCKEKTENEVKSIAFPNISTGIYRFPKQRAAHIALQTIKNCIQNKPKAFIEILFICFDDENYRLYNEIA